MNRKIFQSMAVAVAVNVTPACAVVMSAQGDAHPVASNQPNTVCEQGKPSSTGWAIAHAGMDILTFGIWEIVGTPIEIARTSGDKEAVRCTVVAPAAVATSRDATEPQS